MAEVTLGAIAGFLGGSFDGDPGRTISGVKPIDEAGESDLTFLSNPKYAGRLATTEAAAVLVARGTEGSSERWIRVDDPYVAFARVVSRWFAAVPGPRGISPLSSIAQTAAIGEGVAIGAFVSIGENVVLGERVTIHPGSVVGDGAVIGDDTLLYANVTVYHGSRIGRRCIVHGGAVIGSDGYGFATEGSTHHKIPQIGIVRIEDDVEIGAGTTIDRATLGETVIGAGTKIDNLVQIAHNVKIGRSCLIVAQVGIAGSTTIGDGSVFGGQAGAAGHLEIGSRVMVAAQSAVMKSFEGPATVAGSPARPIREQMRSEALVRRLPEFVERLRRIEQKTGVGKSTPENSSEGA
jgi:UDP-3-O-[3-hydroxymyristoyl] glucosamine N-acyltransferase